MGQHERQGSTFDAGRCYVRICKRRPDGFIEFEFSIGDPELAVELMLPESAFHEFCLGNEVIVLDPVTSDQGDWVSRLNDASRQGFEDAV